MIICNRTLWLGGSCKEKSLEMCTHARARTHTHTQKQLQHIHC